MAAKYVLAQNSAHSAREAYQALSNAVPKEQLQLRIDQERNLMIDGADDPSAKGVFRQKTHKCSFPLRPLWLNSNSDTFNISAINPHNRNELAEKQL